MTAADEKVLQQNVRDLTEQLYASYARVKELVTEIDTLKLKVVTQQTVINGLAGELSGQGTRSE